MERLAIIELTETGTRLLILDSSNGRYNYLKENFDNFPIGEEIDSDKLLKPKTVSKLVNVLTMYREMVQSYGVNKIIGIASNLLLQARNQKGIFEEIYNNTGVQFAITNEEEVVKNVFNSFNNTIDVSKAYGIYVDNYNIYFMKYNRRTVLDYCSIPVGVTNLASKGNYNEMLEIVKNKIKEKSFSFDGGEICIGAGSAFINLGRVAKKIVRYPLEIDNNYLVEKKVAFDVFNFVKGLDLDKIKKVKGVIGTPSEFLAGLAIVEAIYQSFDLSDMTISEARMIDGLVISNVKIEGQDKFTDLLGNSFDNYYEFHKMPFSNNLRVCNMAGILFKQLKVMHKLPRAYVKPMRIASYMYDCGKSVSFDNFEKHNLYTIINSGLCGASQKDLLIAGFIAQNQNPDNFNLSEWMKYKDILSDEDLDAVRKLGVIVKLASALNSSKKETVTDVICDILGDSLIMKTVVSSDASYDILQGMKVSSDYRKIFKKNLQII